MYWHTSKYLTGRWIFLIFLLCGLMRSMPAFGEETYQCRFSSIHYEEPGQLERLTQKVQPIAMSLSLKSILMVNVKPTPEVRAGWCVDQLFQRVQEILGMVEPDLKVEIRLFRNKAALSEVYEKFTGRPTQVPAFYCKETNTIYLDLEELSSGILAHEMAHAVISHFFLIDPPEKTCEVLCQYVDREVSQRSF